MTTWPVRRRRSTSRENATIRAGAAEDELACRIELRSVFGAIGAARDARDVVDPAPLD
jgi:hypothetical protein